MEAVSMSRFDFLTKSVKSLKSMKRDGVCVRAWSVKGYSHRILLVGLQSDSTRFEGSVESSDVVRGLVGLEPTGVEAIVDLIGQIEPLVRLHCHFLLREVRVFVSIVVCVGRHLGDGEVRVGFRACPGRRE